MLPHQVAIYTRTQQKKHLGIINFSTISGLGHTESTVKALSIEHIIVKLHKCQN